MNETNETNVACQGNTLQNCGQGIGMPGIEGTWKEPAPRPLTMRDYLNQRVATLREQANMLVSLRETLPPQVLETEHQKVLNTLSGYPF